MSAPPALRLTRRGRLVLRLGALLLAIVLLCVALIVGVLLGSGTASGADQARPLPVVEHVVAPGETLWQIARRVSPHEDTRDVVLRIVAANDLDGANVIAGTRLIVPLAT